jgi:hypothetical protein
MSPVSSISLFAQKLQSGIGLTKSEEKFFGGVRNFKRNVLKPILKKGFDIARSATFRLGRSPPRLR